ncbi:MerR family transcriptional regulator [Piscibacillus halophilus]|uniref:DNA-binding transcriptional regulator, MerR family n=1 Tax=Piscibacillus halophilus TaxID=571933 RepID=A0A1H9DRE1_9BACI|nr:MerR family transcriptional regulator [Piscibacillus halophilus]SEQ15248.1 DNA-binding transcriptional regulator, MerR family [Piscibacillus halophilus]
MDQRFTIGEMAKLHNIPVKTLRYYDEIGLFKPIEVDPETNYRYYSTVQFEHLNIINYLRELGIPLKDIKHQFDVRDCEYFLEMLENQEARVEKQIQDLKRAKRRLSARINELHNVTQHYGIPKVQLVGDRRMAQLKQPITSHAELELALKTLEHRTGLNASIYIGGVGVTRSLKELPKPVYNSIFLMLEDEDIDHELVTVIPQGEFATLTVNRQRVQAHDYDPLLKFIEENGYKIVGDAIERVMIDEYISQNKKEHLSEIQVPILT